MTKVVVHVVESYGGGVASGIAGYVAATPHLQHRLLAYARPGHGTGDSESAFDKVRFLEVGGREFVAAAARLLPKLEADVVHLHSSYAGFLRSVPNWRRGRRTVYTPHAFGFFREDLPGYLRLSIRGSERIGASRGAVLAGCSPFEAVVGSELGCTAVWVPYGTDVRRRSEEGPARIVGVGRLMVQKDPKFFARVARILRASDPEIEILWVGGGEREYVEELEAAGVTVTGWLSRLQASRVLTSRCIYLHTALWEGMPLTLLEALSAGCAAIVRRRPWNVGLPLSAESFVGSPEEMAARASALARGAADRPSVAAFLSCHSPREQRAALAEVYGLSSGE